MMLPSPRRLILKIRAYRVRRNILNKDSRVELNDPLKVIIIKEKGARFICKGTLRFSSHFGGNYPICIHLRKNATLQIEGDFTLGNGVQIFVNENGFLRIGGKEVETGSGITCDSKIYAYKRIEIGKDFLCAWNVFLTDCDWHSTKYDGVASELSSDVIIGNHVWISHGCNILKGTKIGDGSIVGTNSLLRNKTYPEQSLIVGTPGKVVKRNCEWNRDLLT